MRGHSSKAFSRFLRPRRRPSGLIYFHQIFWGISEHFKCYERVFFNHFDFYDGTPTADFCQKSHFMKIWWFGRYLKKSFFSPFSPDFYKPNHGSRDLRNVHQKYHFLKTYFLGVIERFESFERSL